MSKKSILYHFVSEIDQFIGNFDAKHPELSLSQKKEKEKYARIHALRDKPLEAPKKVAPIWKNF